jgi:hypothetical protein
MSGIEWGIHFIIECVVIFLKGLIGFSVLAFIVTIPCSIINLLDKKEK